MRRLRSALAVVLGAYGAAATLALVALSALRDGTVVTYAAGLVSFWWLLPAPPLVVLAVLLRTWRAALLLAVPALVWFVAHGPPVLPDRSGPVDLRVAVFNIEPGRSVDHVEDLTEREDLDVLLLQEVSPQAREGLARQLPDHPHAWFGPVPRSVAPAGAGGTAVLSAHPIVDVAPVTGLPAGARGSAVVTLDVDGRELRVIPLHLASPCLTCSSASARDNPAGDAARAARVRVAEARRYAEVVRALVADGRAVAAGGDLNSAELNQPVPILLGAGLVDVHRQVGTGPALTRRPGPGLARIDALLVSGLRPVATREGDAGRSEHSPVVADLAW